MRIRPATPADHDAVRALNQEAVPAMNPVDAAFLDHFGPLAVAFLVAEDGAGRVTGFLLVLPSGLAYDSTNYRWFTERYDDFVYVDRIAVAAADRGRGIGSALYAALDTLLAGAGDAGGAAPRGPICCEVNVRPPNPRSLAFHRRLGFRVVGEQDTEGGAKRVALMVVTDR